MSYFSDNGFIQGDVTMASNGLIHDEMIDV